jgi:alpha-beta hydrolase superfamily lysophospholipase
MGGLVAADLLLTDPTFEARGLILSNPLFGLAFTPPVIKTTAAKLLSKILPALSLGNEVNVEHLSRDPEVQAAYKTDPLVTTILSPRWFTEMLSAISRVDQEGKNITCPTLLLQGSGDQVTSIEASAAMVEKFGSQSKTTKCYEGLYHEILNEPEKELVIADIIAWLDSKI